jgi:hypothetical protein
MVAREGIERRAYLAELKGTFQNSEKVTLKMDPSKGWLLADVHGSSAPTATEEIPVRVLDKL